MPSDKNRISLEFAAARLIYNPESGSLKWKMRSDDRPDAARWNNQFAGTEAGSINKYGYRRIGIAGVHVHSHRVAWLFIHGEWPDHEVDHIDRNRSNNAASNLRKASRSENGGNKTIHRNNTSGKKGVSWHKRLGKWAARIRVDGKLKHLGYFEDLDDAAASYRAAAVEFFGEFATEGAIA